MNSPEFDVVIVGAGASGAMFAARCVSQGLNVAMLEAGLAFTHRQDYIDRFYSQAVKVPGAPWPKEKAADAPSAIDVNMWRSPSNYMLQGGEQGDVPFGSTYERISGGTLNHWVGTSLRMLPNDFKLATNYLVPGSRDWPICYSDLRPWYDVVESEIGVAGNDAQWANYLGADRNGVKFPMPQIPQSYLDQLYIQKLQNATVTGKMVNVLSTPQARNSIGYRNRPPCMGNNSCVPICPIEAKYDARVHLKLAISPPEAWTKANSRVRSATIYYQSVATSVVVGDNDRIIGILYRQWQKTASGEYKFIEKPITGRLYVLASHAIETSKLLLMSPWKRGMKVANRSDQVGRNLMDHICQVSWARTVDPVYPFRGPLSTSGIGDFRDGPERRERAAYIIEIGNEGWNWPVGAPYSDVFGLLKRGLWGKSLRAAVQEQVTRQIRMAAELESLPLANSYVTPSAIEKDELGISRPEVHYKLSDYTKRGFAESCDSLSGIFRILGAEELTTVDANNPAVFTWNGKTYQYRGAGHIMGTYRMGANGTDSVVDEQCRSHDHRNLILLGSGVFPSSATGNPTLTLLALAVRAADTVLRDDFNITPSYVEWA